MKLMWMTPPPRSLPPALFVSIVTIMTVAWWIAATQPVASQTTLAVPADYPTLEHAIDAADPGDLIQLAEGTFTLGHFLHVTKQLTIAGEGMTETFIDGDGSHWLVVADATGITISDLTIQNGSSGQDGGLLASGGSLTLERVRLRQGTSDLNGGAIFHNGTTLVLRDSIVEDNTGVRGGAIYADSGTVTIEDTTFRNNISTHADGGHDIYSAAPATITITRSQFQGAGAGSTYPAVVLAEGSISRSAFLDTANPALSAIGTPATNIDARGNWWRDATGPGTRVGDHIDTAPWIASLALSASPGAPTTGSSVTVSAQLRDEHDDAIAGEGVRVRIIRSGEHSLAPPGQTLALSPTAAHTYTGATAGTDTVEAAIRFGNAESADSHLEQTLQITWTNPAPPPPDPAPPPTPTPTPTPTPGKFAALEALGVLTGRDDVEELDLRTLAIHQIAQAFSVTQISDNGSSMGLPPGESPFMDSFHEWNKQAMHGPQNHSQFGDEELTDTVLNHLVLKSLGVVEFEDTKKLTEHLGFALPWINSASDGDNSAGSFGEQSKSFLILPEAALELHNSARLQIDVLQLEDAGLHPVEDDLLNDGESSDEDSPQASLLMLQMARADLSDGLVDELALMYVDLGTGAWHQVDAMFIELIDGRIGIAAYITEHGLYSIVHRAQVDVPLPGGTALLTWRGIDGSPPERALASAQGIRALFQQDPDTGRWSVFYPGAPTIVQSLTALHQDTPLFVVAEQSGGTWRLPVW